MAVLPDLIRRGEQFDDSLLDLMIHGGDWFGEAVRIGPGLVILLLKYGEVELLGMDERLDEFFCLWRSVLFS